MQSPQSSTPLPTLGNLLPERQQEAMNRLFQRMQAMYGHAWSSMFPDAECVAEWSETWFAGLADLTLADIGKGVAAALKDHQRFAPSLPEFRQCCKPRTEPAHQKYLPPPRPAVNVAAHMTAVKESMERQKASEWWKNANALTVSVLSHSADPEAHAILEKIAEHNPTLYPKRRAHGWVAE